LTSGSLLTIPPKDAAAGPVASATSTTDGDVDAGTSTPAVTSSGAGIYQVQPGDTLSAIAGRLGVSVQSLAAANGLDPTGLLISGTTLHAVGGAGTSAASPSTSPSSSNTSGAYVVQRGDTLRAIAARLGVSVDSLAAANGLDPTGLLISGTSLHSVGGLSSSSSAAP